MNAKQIVGLVFAALGVFLISYAVYSNTHVYSAKTHLHEMTQSKNPIVNSIGKDMEAKVSNYGTKNKWFFYGGGVLVILGGAAVYFYKKHKRR